MRLRALGAAALAVTAVFTLAGCRVQPGAAAFVGDQRISESQVLDLVAKTVPATDTASGQLPPRSSALATLVATQVLRDYVATTTGGIPSQTELEAGRAAAFEKVTGSALPNLADLTPAVEKLGFDADFVQAYIDQIQIEYVAITRFDPDAQPAAFFAEVEKKTPAVRVSPRYGAWNPEQLSLAGVAKPPAYLQLSATAATPAA